ncbi:hypothetical protein H70357_24680 [Paenibacillus sp. FSL H7-0357]|uniref:hypothetical protein n=1 Tax=Paenibacillus sp. FSL H7-0357 TaxID=1536774 RepID=UPI0004F8EEF5|nr:hypothetical protein [Paenibacillus sp. FSL H7-0357]AIQ19551.1 hypothetical protein H70357_24680 [Paenibacillus sp. FSL H7-0357]
MTQVQEWSNERLNIALSKLMGRTEPTAIMVNYDMIAKYCEDPAASLEVQTAAIKANARMYAINLAKRLKWDEDGDPLSFSDNDLFSYTGVANFFTATHRERAEAAYITLSSKQ